MQRTIVTIALLAPLCGCKQVEALITASIPPEVQAQLDQQEAALAEYDKAILRVEEQAKEVAKRAQDAVQASDYATAQTLMAQLDTLQTEHKGLVDLYVSTADEARDSIEDSVEGAASGVLGMLDPVVPVPLQPLVPALSSLLVMAGSRRSRKHTKKALRHVAVGNLGTGVKDILKAVGASHSSEASQKVVDEEEQGERAQQAG